MEAFGAVTVPGDMERLLPSKVAGMLNGRTVPHDEELSPLPGQRCQERTTGKTAKGCSSSGLIW